MQTTFVRQEMASPVGRAGIRRGCADGARGGGLAPKGAAALRPRNPFAAPAANGNGNSNRSLIEALAASKIYHDYERAFSEATNLPLALRPVESWQLPFHGKHHENPFCQMLAQKSRACAACMQVQEKLAHSAAFEAHSVTCPAGLCDIAVPIRLGDRLIGFLQTGQIFRKKPTAAQFERTAKLVADWGVSVDRESLREAFFATQTVSLAHHSAVVKLLSIFAQHLSILSNQVVMQQENSEPPVILRAKEYIHENLAEAISLGQVAKAVNTSTFYFCKIFKRVTGINFTDYVSRVRIEKSKNLLLNPNLRISEIAFEVGFQSLTHFNRVFKKILGQSPTEYRAQLLGH